MKLRSFNIVTAGDDIRGGATARRHFISASDEKEARKIIKQIEVQEADYLGQKAWTIQEVEDVTDNNEYL